MGNNANIDPVAESIREWTKFYQFFGNLVLDDVHRHSFIAIGKLKSCEVRLSVKAI